MDEFCPPFRYHLPLMQPTLRDFLNHLDRQGELTRINAPVSPILEVAEITQRVSRSPAASTSRHSSAFDPAWSDQGGHALLFENIEGCDFPLAINVLGSYRRMEMALGVDDSSGFESIAKKIASLTKPQPPRSLGEMIAKAREFAPLLRIPPRRKRRGRCQEVVKLTSRGEVDLTRIPIIKCWPLDGNPLEVGYPLSAEASGTAKGEGRFITFAGMHTIHADDEGVRKPASHNIGMYRAQLIDEEHLVMHWHVHHDGAAHWRSWKRKNKPMPIAICLGGESVLPYAATAPLPPGISELLMAGFLNGRGIPLVRAKTVPLWVPANCEIVIEGWVSTECGDIGFDPRHGESQLGPGAAFEGPFGDHTGYYSLPDRYPIVEVSAVTHRRDAIYPTTIVGYPPQEDYYLGKATERIFLPLLRTLIPDIVDYHLPRFGCFHNCAFIKIHKQYALQARRVMHAVWGAGQMSWTKFIIVVDDDVEVHDEKAVLRAMFERCHFVRDIEIVHGPLDILDHAAPFLGAGHKMGFDATRKVRGESVNGVSFDVEVRTAKERLEARSIRCESPILAADAPDFGGGRCAFLQLERQDAGDGRRALQTFVESLEPDSSADFVIAVDRTASLHDWENVLFNWCANCDPGRDLHRFDRGSAGTSPLVAFDATAKLPSDGGKSYPVRDYPPLIAMDESTRERVSTRWHEYGLD